MPREKSTLPDDATILAESHDLIEKLKPLTDEMRGKFSVAYTDEDKAAVMLEFEKRAAEDYDVKDLGQIRIATQIKGAEMRKKGEPGTAALAIAQIG